MNPPETMSVRMASTAPGLVRPLPQPTWSDRLRAGVAQVLTAARDRVAGHRNTVIGVVAVAVVVTGVVVFGPMAVERVQRSAETNRSNDPVLPMSPLAELPLEVGAGAPSVTSGAGPHIEVPVVAGSGVPPTASALSMSSITTSPSPVGPPSPTVVVHAAGAVIAPGVYRLSDPARVTDVLSAAGGLTGEADPDVLNLAARVGDGERIFVPRRGQPLPGVVVGTTASGPSPSRGGAERPAAAVPIDLNVATATQLDSLPGIGPAIAERIVQQRVRLGRFRSVNQLLDVPGIGEAKFASLKPRVKV